MNQDIKKRVLTIKAEIGTEKAKQVADVIRHMSNNKSTPATILEALIDKFELTPEQAGICWYAWQIYKL